VRDFIERYSIMILEYEKVLSDGSLTGVLGI